MTKKSLPFGKKKKGRVPNPDPTGALTLLVNPGEPPGSKERGGTVAKKKGKKKKKSNPSTPKKTSNPKKKRKSSSKKTNPSKKKKRKRNPDENALMKWNQGLEGVPQALPAVLSGLGGWATPGLLAALIGPQARKQLADYVKGPANAQLLLSTITFGGWWAATSYFKDLRKYRKAVLMGNGIRWFFDLANAFLPVQAGSLSSNVRAFLGLPGGDMTMALPGVTPTTTTPTTTGTPTVPAAGVIKSSIKTDTQGKFLSASDGSYDYGTADVVVKDGAYYDKDTGKLLVKDDGTTPWKTTDVTLSGYHGGGTMGGWQNFQPFMAQTIHGWQYFQPVMAGNQLSGYNVGACDAQGNLAGWQYFQPTMAGPQQGGNLGLPPALAYTNMYNVPVNGMGNSPSRAMMPAPGFQFAGGGNGANTGAGQDHTAFRL